MSELTDQAQSLEILATNLRVESALVRALDLLEGLPVAVFKGPLLTRRIYGDLRCRASADNDLWVPPEYVQETLARFLQAGYRPVAGLDAERSLQREGQIALWPDGDDRRVSVDLHAYPFRTTYFDVPSSLIEAHLEEAAIQGRTVRCFDLPLSFVHLVAHYVQHHFEPGLLADLGAAWNAWGKRLQARPDFVQLADRTCSMEAVEYALVGASRAGHVRVSAPPLTRRRARLCVRLCPPDRLPRSVVRKLCSVLLVAPHKLPQDVARAMLLEQDDLESRYGAGPRPWLIARHVAWTLRGGRG